MNGRIARLLGRSRREGATESRLFPGQVPVARKPRGRTFAVLYMAWAAAVGVVLAALATGRGYGALPFHGAVGGFIGAELAWRWTVGAAQEASTQRGIAAGLVAAPLGTGIAIYVMMIQANVEYWLLGHGSEPPMNLLVAIPVAVLGGAALQPFLGIVTLPVGALIGAASARH